MFLIQYITLFLLLNTSLLDSFTSLDLATLETLNGSRITDLDIVLLALTSSAYGLGVVVPCYLFLVGHFRRIFPLKLKAYQYILAMGINVVFVGTLKYAIDRPRPFISNGTITQIAEASSPSFPSGHTAFAFTAAVALALLFRDMRLTAIAFVWAFLVAYSRLALGVHYPSDVAASILLGTSASLLAHFFFQKYKGIAALSPNS